MQTFLDSIPEHSTLFDVGCGNGKYQSYPRSFKWLCNDTCEELISIAKARHYHPQSECQYMTTEGSSLPYPSSSIDHGICIAVLHHLQSYNERLKFLKELVRVLRPSGTCLLTVWSNRENKDKRKLAGKWTQIPSNERYNSDYHVPWSDKSGMKHQRFYHLFDRDEVEQLCQDADVISDIFFDENNWNIIIRKPSIGENSG